MKRAKATSKKEVIEVTMDRDEFIALSARVTSESLSKLELKGEIRMLIVELFALYTVELTKKIFMEEK